MRLAKALDEKKYDVRLRDKNLSEGKLSKKDLDSYVKDLSDDGSEATTTGEASNKSSAE